MPVPSIFKFRGRNDTASNTSHTEDKQELKPDLFTTDGPIGIKVLADPSNAEIDIVFIHGLTGNREKTWTHENGTYWPKALLSEDIPQARIMTFSYDADIVRLWSIASSNKLRDHGKSLAYALLERRDSVGQRPILFITHSLGGLVCEAALVLSNQRHEIASILKNTMGIIFLGTPHSGSDLANWGVNIARCLSVVRGTNRDILKALQPDSMDLQQVEDDFQHILHQRDAHIILFCFYEELQMNDTFGKIVEDRSAILSGYGSCSIHADHRNMTKFSGRTDAGYIQVQGVVKRWINDYQQKAFKSNKGEDNEDLAQDTKNQKAQPAGMNFYGPISGRNVVTGVQSTHGTNNFTFN